MALRIIFLAVCGMVIADSETDWTSQCSRCRCLWSGGMKWADCRNTNLSKIPKDLSSQLRIVDFSNNPIYNLEANQFVVANLRDVHKLKLQNCSLEAVHETAFYGLAQLIELDLSRNNIVKLHRNVLKENLKLRILSLSHNRIRVLEDGLFYNMTHLQKIYLSHNEIEEVNPEAFTLLETLNHLDLENNKIKTIQSDFTQGLTRLSSLNIAANPWICDCRIEEFRSKIIRNNLITAPTTCEEPPRLKGSLWTDPNVKFACTPRIVEPLPDTRIEVTSNTFTMVCKVLGEPKPDVDWVYNNRIIDKDPRQSSQRYNQSKNKTGLFTYNNLTVTGVSYRDRGDYRCVAKNPAGVDERNVTVVISAECDGCGLLSPVGAIGNSLPLIIGLVIGAIILLLLILLLSCCLCKRNSRNFGNKRHDLGQSSEYIGLDGRPEMEKALITDVNPIVKPPRQCSVPPSVTSGATEVSEVNKTLLDGDSIFAGDEESRSYDFDPRLPQKSQTHLDIDYRTDHPYPPDLLSFPHRVVQVSPAGSSASTVADTSRLPPPSSHHIPQQSPLTSPLYEPVSVYRTLPYSRSQSPFVGVHARVPRPGAYVTIPRRPRQSWSSEPPPSGEQIAEPLYDNLGIRTTALGSTKSMNKVGELTSPRSAKSPIMSPVKCEAIAEHETATLPRRGASPGIWAKQVNGGLKGAEQTNNMREGKVAKVPPQPPPKPKKRTSTGPLFEDEGEDGTEV